MNAKRAVADLLRESLEWRRFFKACCEVGTIRLCRQTWQFRDELEDKGQQFRLEEVEDALLVLAREVLPESGAAKWNLEWACMLAKKAIDHLGQHYARLLTAEKEALDLSAQDVWDKRMQASAEANNPVAFRQALAGWEQAGLGALEKFQAERAV
jgi:hypothetical protein